MDQLFDSSNRFVIIYSSNGPFPGTSPHVRHRKFSNWVEKKRKDFQLKEFHPNHFPYNPKVPDTTSFSDFYVYARYK